ncbi:MAG: SAM-dependent methyltransferase, partial [Salegentibacter mishustinae]|nr:SAM-dependent methyltransferase [Salegentibacter mishustinae]
MTSNRSFSNEFWTQRYEQNQTGWDIGEISRPLKTYIDQLEDKNLKILIPGAGNAYEAEYLFKQGFKNVYVADISEKPLQNLIARVPTFPKNQLLNINFFEIEDKFDLILEQTFFCALPIDSRKDYAMKTAELLKQDALLSGL